MRLDPSLFPEMVKARFWQNTRRTDSGCWEWQGNISVYGYGIFMYNYQPYRAHRVSKRLSGVEVPNDMVIDHICKNKKCVAPEHLRVCTNVENTMIGDGPPAVNARKTSCIRGHTYAEHGYFYQRNGKTWRNCRVCMRAAASAYKKRARERAKGPHVECLREAALLF